MNIREKTIIMLLPAILLFATMVQGGTGTRVGTTSAQFLEFGFNVAGNAMGETQFVPEQDLSAMFWNPAALAYLKQSEVQINYLPWIQDINSSFIGAAYVHPTFGTFALSLYQTSFGEEKVRTVTRPEGTGEKFDGQDFCLSLSYGRKLATWFSFGSSIKYIQSRIWHETGQAVAVDLGAVLKTWFFNSTDNPGDGLNIAMSISNYGTPMQYDGIDLKDIVDISPFEEGNYAFSAARLETDKWELPLVARIGISLNPLVTERQRFTLSSDFLHANNNSEYINVGGQYAYKFPALGTVFLRGGYKGLFMVDSEYGMTLGFGISLNYLGNQALKIDYAFKDTGVLGGMHAYSIGFVF